MCNFAIVRHFVELMWYYIKNLCTPTSQGHLLLCVCVRLKVIFVR